MTKMATPIATSPYRAAFSELRDGAEPSWLTARRQEAMVSFDASGIPTRRHEEWRYLDLSSIARIPFQHAASSPPALYDRKNLESALRSVAGGVADQVLDTLGEQRLVFVDGRFRSELSRLPESSAGVVISNLAQSLDDHRETVERHLTQYASFADNPFVALNTAFMQDGAFVWIGRGARLTQPLHLVHVSTGQNATASHPRHLIVMEEGSSGIILEDYVSAGSDPALCNPVMEVALAPGARLTTHKLAREGARTFHLAATFVRQERDSDLTSFSIVRGGRLVRNDLRSEVAGPGASCTLNGLNVVCGTQVADDHTVVVHSAPHGTSREYYKSILDERAEGVFSGKVFVREGAQKTDAQQSNRNLLLSDEALMNTKPQLEIFTDDVKCSHGATIGQLEPEAIYYLRSRGLDLDAARSLLTQAFASDVLDKVSCEPVRDLLRSTLTFPLCRRAGHPIRH